MGVKGIWSLLGATGRKAEVQCLGNKAVAVDASIWIVQVDLGLVAPNTLSHTLFSPQSQSLGGRGIG